jgi:hypothetical protein
MRDSIETTTPRRKRRGEGAIKAKGITKAKAV